MKNNLYGVLFMSKCSNSIDVGRVSVAVYRQLFYQGG